MTTCQCAEASHATRGFSLIEALVATALITIAVGGLAHLAAVATSSNQRAHLMTRTTLLASTKVEELLAVPWVEQAAQASNSDASLKRNVPGFFDLLDAEGRAIGVGSRTTAGVAYVRRWSVRILPEDPGNAVVLHVIVAASASAGGSRTLARMSSVRARRDWWASARP